MKKDPSRAPHAPASAQSWKFLGFGFVLVVGGAAVNCSSANAFSIPFQNLSANSAPRLFTAFQDREAAVKRMRAEKEAKELLDRVKKYQTELSYGRAYETLLEIKKTYPDTAAGEEGVKMLPDAKTKAEKGAVELIEKAEKLRKADDYAGAEKKLKEVVEQYPSTEVVPKAQKLLTGVQKLISDEKEAANALKLIRNLADDPNKVEQFRRQAEILLKKYPNTKAAAETRTLLKKLN